MGLMKQIKKFNIKYFVLITIIKNKEMLVGFSLLNILVFFLRWENFFSSNENYLISTVYGFWAMRNDDTGNIKRRD
jgi:hypothetical protein